MLFGFSILPEAGGLVLGSGTLLYACSSLIGYFGFGSAPFFKFTRINIIPLVLIVLAFGSIGLGGLSNSMNLILLILVNLYDANCAATNERTPQLIDRVASE